MFNYIVTKLITIPFLKPTKQEISIKEKTFMCKSKKKVLNENVKVQKRNKLPA